MNSASREERPSLITHLRWYQAPYDLGFTFNALTTCPSHPQFWSPSPPPFDSPGLPQIDLPQIWASIWELNTHYSKLFPLLWGLKWTWNLSVVFTRKWSSVETLESNRYYHTKFWRYRATDHADRSNMNIGLYIPSPVRSEQYLCERPPPIPAPKGIERISSDSSKPCWIQGSAQVLAHFVVALLSRSCSATHNKQPNVHIQIYTSQ